MGRGTLLLMSQVHIALSRRCQRATKTTVLGGLVVACFLFGETAARAEPGIVGPEIVNGLAEGSAVYELVDGTKMTTSWRSGRKHGAYQVRLANGVLSEQGSYKHGQRSGPWIFRDKQGRVLFTRGYELGRFHGLATAYAEIEGKWRLRRSIEYVLGQRHGREQRWDGATERYVHDLWNVGQLVDRHRFRRHVEVPSGWSGQPVRVLGPGGLTPSSTEWPEIQSIACEASAALSRPILVSRSLVSCRRDEEQQDPQRRFLSRKDGSYSSAKL